MQNIFKNSNKISSKGVGALIFAKSTKKYLFLLRCTSSHPDTWGIAGGKIGYGETLEGALIREINEELGIIPKFKKLIPIEIFTSNDNNFQFLTYFIPVENEFTPILNSEHKGYCWASISDCPSPLHPGVETTIKTKENFDKIKIIEHTLHND